VQSRAMRVLIRSVYDVVNTALWALVAAMALLFLFNIPTMMQAQRARESLLILELAEESRTYCEKWGLTYGTVQHRDCIQDLQEVREKAKSRLLAEMQVF
jgi:hypothetical protein